MTLRIGVDVGQRTEPSGLCVVQTETRDGAHGSEAHFMVRHLERLPVGTSYPTLADRAAEVAAAASERAGTSPYLYLNATGRGEPVVKLFSSRIRQARVVGVYFTHGDRRECVSTKEIRLGKAHLVTALQTLLQTGCLHIPETPEAMTLVDELLDFQVPQVEDANQREGSFRVGSRDELVTALGLATQEEQRSLQVF